MSMKKYFLIVGLLVVGLMIGIVPINQAIHTSEAKTGYIDVTPAKAKELIDTVTDLVIIDVSPKYAEGHLPKAINYYAGDGSLDKAIPTLDKNKPYLVYCHVDSVSILGAQKLVDAGFRPVYRLQGNYSAWVDAGYPVEK
jgi:rhodanese-related sulfurtransferase